MKRALVPANSSEPVPPKAIARVNELLASAWGLTGVLARQPSERDEIYKLTIPDGRTFTLRLTNPGEDGIATEFQTAALQHAATRDPDLPIPKLVPDKDGRVAFRPNWGDGPTPTARLLTWLDGLPLVAASRSEAQAASMGNALAKLGLALDDFDHPGADHDLPQDLRHTAELRPFLTAIDSGPRRAIAEAAMDRFDRSVAPQLPTLRSQVVHNDLNPHNVLVDERPPHVLTGIIDFGDVVRTILIGDVAIAACYLLGQGADAMSYPQALVAAYDRVRPLTIEELLIVPALMEARLLMTVAITEWHAAHKPENRVYITKNTALAWHGLEMFAEHPARQWGIGFVAACKIRKS